MSRSLDFTVISGTVPIVRARAADGQMWEIRIGVNVTEVFQRDGMDGNGNPIFDLDIGWNARWRKAEDH